MNIKIWITKLIVLLPWVNLGVGVTIVLLKDRATADE